MNDTNRRGFIGRGFAWLASLPLLSAWMARPAEAYIVPSQKSIMAWSPCDLQISDGPLLLIYSIERSRYEVAAASAGHALDSKIRWIPWPERLPENKAGSILICYYGEYVGKAPAVDLMPTLPNGGFNEYYMHSLKVTHWAELPAPPTGAAP